LVHDPEQLGDRSPTRAVGRRANIAEQSETAVAG
jgi:hypothetical protein